MGNFMCEAVEGCGEEADGRCYVTTETLRAELAAEKAKREEAELLVEQMKAREADALLDIEAAEKDAERLAEALKAHLDGRFDHLPMPEAVAAQDALAIAALAAHRQVTP